MLLPPLIQPILSSHTTLSKNQSIKSNSLCDYFNLLLYQHIFFYFFFTLYCRILTMSLQPFYMLQPQIIHPSLSPHPTLSANQSNASRQTRYVLISTFFYISIYLIFFFFIFTIYIYMLLCCCATFPSLTPLALPNPNAYNNSPSPG